MIDPKRPLFDQLIEGTGAPSAALHVGVRVTGQCLGDHHGSGGSYGHAAHHAGLLMAGLVKGARKKDCKISAPYQRNEGLADGLAGATEHSLRGHHTEG
jgi:hypothetical protein